MLHDDSLVPMDLRYMNFLNALDEIHDETMRNRCYKSWTSLYQYFDHSMTSERALALEEKRAREILHRFNIEIASHQSEIAYQVRNILQRGHQVLADLHTKYNRKKNNLREIEQNIDDLETQIQNKKSESSIKTVSSSSTSFYQITEAIDNLKLQIKDLRRTREALQMELNIEKTSYFSMQIQAYHIQQNIYKAEKELVEIQHELTFNLQTIHEQENQLNQLLLYKQNIYIPIDREYLNIDYHSIKDQLKNEQKITLELKKHNQELNNTLIYHIQILKVNENKQTQLNINDKNMIEIIHIKQEEIEKEKELKRDISQTLIKLQTELQRKQRILSIHHRQEEKLKNQIIQLEYKRNECFQHTTIHTFENINPSTNNIQQEVRHRLQLTIIHQNLKHETNTLENNAKQYILLVKEQRQKILNYEKLHDKWIIHININRNRLLELFNRINTIDQHMITTNKFLEQFDHTKLSLILQNEIHFYIQRRKEKNKDMNINTTDESKSSLNMKLYQMEKILYSNQTIFHQIKQTISLADRNYSTLLNQISTIDKQRIHLIEYLDSLDNKWFVGEQGILNSLKKSDHLKHTIDSNNQKNQRFKQEKEKIILFLLEKQRLIVLVNKHIELNEQNLNKRRLSYNKLMNKIQQIRNKVLWETQQIKPIGKQHQLDMKRLILCLRKELLECKRKNNDFQHRIHRQHITRQILTKYDNKSILKETNEQYCINLQQKASSIIYRLICKTHYNIILYKRLDVLIENILILYTINQQPLKTSYLFHRNNSFKKTNQLKAYIAEVRALKNEILIYKQIYINIKDSLKDYFFI